MLLKKHDNKIYLRQSVEQLHTLDIRGSCRNQELLEQAVRE